MWRRIDAALRLGLRGLQRGSSLARLLDHERGVPNQKALPHLHESDIVAWAEAHFQRTGRWPTENSGPIPESGDERWLKVEAALRTGVRGLPGGESLHQLLVRTFGTQTPGHPNGIRSLCNVPELTVEQILGWADAHFARTGRWPKNTSGRVAEEPARKWSGINAALADQRVSGISAASSIAQLLAEHRGVRNVIRPPRMSVRQILVWADAHQAQTGQWPEAESGPITQAEGESGGPFIAL